MTDNELKKLNRKELLEMLLQQIKENEELEEKIKDLEQKLEDRSINLTEAGSIAEAALKVNDVFAVAQAAANQYLENVEKLCGNQKMLCDAMEAESKVKAAAMIADAERKCKAREKAADEYVARASEVMQKMGSIYQDYKSSISELVVENNEEENE